MITASQPIQSTTPTELLNKEPLARRLGKSPRTISAYMARKVVPFIKVSRRTVYFEWNDVLERLRAIGENQ
jgi:hypothetical protein